MSHSPEPGGAGLFLASQQHRLCEQGGCLACLPCPSLSQDGPQPPGTLSQRHAQVPPLWSAEDRQVSVLLRQRAQCGPAPRADAGPCHWLSHKPLPGRLISELPRPRPSQNALLLTVLWHLPGSVLKPLHKLIILHNVAGSSSIISLVGESREWGGRGADAAARTCWDLDVGQAVWLQALWPPGPAPSPPCRSLNHRPWGLGDPLMRLRKVNRGALGCLFSGGRGKVT